jgi:hypothetical protein
MTSTLLFYNIKIKIFILIYRFIMLEYLILLIFIGLMFHPLKMDPLAKVVELVLLVYAGYKNPLIGVFCAIVFIYSMSIQPVPQKSESLPISTMAEKMRPQESNQVVCTGKTVDTHYLPNEPYTAYNVEL